MPVRMSIGIFQCWFKKNCTGVNIHELKLSLYGWLPQSFCGSLKTVTVNGDNDVHLYSAVTPCYCSMLGVLGRVVSFEACCHIVCKSLDTTLLCKLTVQKYMDPFVSKAHAGFFCVSVIHQTLTWTTGSLRDHSYACVYTQGLGTPTASLHNIFYSKTHKFFLCFWQGLNLGSLIS